MAVLGIDVGTTACKCAVFEEDGAVLSVCADEYAVSGADLDCVMLFGTVKNIIKRAAAESNVKIEAVCVSSFGETFVPVDKDGVPLAEAMLYTDLRGKNEAEELQTHADTILTTAGVTPHQMYGLAKMMYLKRTSPDIYDKAHKLLQIQDYIIFRLCGEAVTDYSQASRTMAFDIHDKRFSQDILCFGGVEIDKMPAPMPSGTVVARILPSLADELGLDKSCQIVTGGHDQVCAALGAGVLGKGMGVDGIGTVECITPFLDKPLDAERTKSYGFASVPYAAKGSFTTYAFIYTGGALIKWYRENFLRYETEKCPDIYAHLGENLKKDPTGIFVLPHFAGAATPHMDGAATGAIIGLNLKTDKYDLYKAALEGITYEMMLNIEKLGDAGAALSVLNAVGGGSRSDDWLQLKADMTGIPYRRIANTEGGVTGAAMLAFTALGKFKTLHDAAETFVKPGKLFEPDLKQTAAYKELFEKYKRIYPKVKEITGV